MNPVKKFHLYNLLVVAALLLSAFGAVSALAGDTTAGAEAAKGASITLGQGLAFIAAGLCVLGSCVGAGIAVGRAASASVGAISEKPELMTKCLIMVGLAEGIAIYGVVIAIIIIFRVS